MKPDARLRRLLQLTQKKSDALFISSPENVQYFSGFTGTAGAILATKGYLHFLTDGRYKTQSQEQIRGFHIHIVTNQHPLAAVCNLAQKWKIKRLGVEEGKRTWDESRRMQKYLPHVVLEPIQTHIQTLRMQKDAEEIALIRRACEISDQGLASILGILRPGTRESEIASELEYQMRTYGARKTAFDTIVASGPRSALPHGIASGRKLQKGDFVVIDFGADVAGYKADITRTFVLGRANAQQKKIWEAVYSAQQKGIDEVELGVPAKQIDKQCRNFLSRRRLGKSFVHGTGHGVGLDIHEAPTVSSKSPEKLRKRMVITVEPGVYIPGWGGVRIEDTLLVTDRGAESLTRSPKVMEV